MEILFGLAGALIIGLVLGYLLATHIHSIADAAAAKVVNRIAMSVGETAVLESAPIAPAVK